MKATYIGTGAHDDDRVCRVFGREFALGEAVDVSDLDEDTQGRLAGNPTFTTDAGAKKAAPKTDAA